MTKRGKAEREQPPRQRGGEERPKPVAGGTDIEHLCHHHAAYGWMTQGLNCSSVSNR